MTRRRTAGAAIADRPHWAIARLFYPARAEDGSLRIYPTAFGQVGGPPPVGFVCERCHPGRFPDYPQGKARTDQVRQIQAQRFCLGPLYRHCPRCQRVTVHFPSPEKAPTS